MFMSAASATPLNSVLFFSVIYHSEFFVLFRAIDAAARFHFLFIARTFFSKTKANRKACQRANAQHRGKIMILHLEISYMFRATLRVQLGWPFDKYY